MNLQVTVPYIPCMFACPFCIARNRSHQNNFKHINTFTYLQLPINVIHEYSIKTVVITGECDPAQQEQFTNILTHTVYNTGTTVEIQTSDPLTFTFDNKHIYYDVLAVSIYNMRQLRILEFALTHPKEPTKQIRPVFILNSMLNIAEISKFLDAHPKIKQVTFKTMQLGEDLKANEWIAEHHFTDWEELELLKQKHSHLSIFVDTNCQDSEGRYLIFRPDGKLYQRWEDKEPI